MSGKLGGERASIGLAPGASPEAAGQDLKKYETSNPVVKRLLDRWARRVGSTLEGVLVEAGSGSTILDVGIGEGLAIERILGVDRPILAVEYRHDKLKAACVRLPSMGGSVADAGMLPFPDGSVDVVTSIEVLEHLVEPEQAVVEMARVCRPGGAVVVSVPWEPWFRFGNLGRGKNITRFGNDPEHVGWYGPRSLAGLLRSGFDSVQVSTAFPWLVGVGRHPGV